MCFVNVSLSDYFICLVYDFILLHVWKVSFKFLLAEVALFVKIHCLDWRSVAIARRKSFATALQRCVCAGRCLGMSGLGKKEEEPWVVSHYCEKSCRRGFITPLSHTICLLENMNCKDIYLDYIKISSVVNGALVSSIFHSEPKFTPEPAAESFTCTQIFLYAYCVSAWMQNKHKSWSIERIKFKEITCKY